MAKKNIMNNLNSKNTLGVERVKVDMNSTWAKTVLIPALKEIRENPSRPWTMIRCPLNLINLFEGQRELKHSYLSILRNFDYKQSDVKSVNFRDGYIECWDGHHTIESLIAKGYKWAWTRLFDNLTVEEEAHLFMHQNDGVTRVSPADMFNCARKLNLEPAVSILKICDKYNVTVGGKKGSLRNITAPRKLLQIYDEFGDEGVNYALALIDLSGWADHDSKAFVEASLNIGYQAYKRYGNDMLKTIKLVKALEQYATSTEFIDAQRKEFKDVSTKHPEGCMGLFVEKVIEGK